MSRAGKPWARLAIHAGDRSSARCLTYRARTPILSIEAGCTAVSVCVSGGTVDADTVAFARSLAAQARRFAAEVERLHGRHGNLDQIQRAA